MDHHQLLIHPKLHLTRNLQKKHRSLRRSFRLQEASVYSVVDEDSVLDVSNVTVGRGSERKTRSRKKNDTSIYSVTDEITDLDISNITTSNINESSILDMSNVTVGRGSEKKSRIRKVSFMSPVMSPRTPKNSNIKMRPKTPIVSRTPLIAVISPSPMKQLKVNLGARVDSPMYLSSLAKKTSGDSDIKSSSLLVNKEMSAKKKTDSTPASKLTRSFTNKNELSKKKRVATPNFKKIHEKAFEKMESIDDYQKRVINSAKKMGILKSNKVVKAKTKIATFGGIPFIPSKSSTNFVASNVKKIETIKEKKKSPKKDIENINTKRSKNKFDLKASLSRKLGYKPYTGPLKPLTPSNALNTSSVGCDHKNKSYLNTPAKEPVNKVVTSNRLQSRSILKGVRTNKRFELQMKNRLLQ